MSVAATMPVSVFPARAGMSPPTQTREGSGVGFPRPRGDEPYPSQADSVKR